MRIICTAKIANTSVGHVDHAMAYAAGFQRLGHEVYVMDYVGSSRCVDDAGERVAFAAWSGRQHFEAVARRYGLWPRCSLIAWDRQTHGMPLERAVACAKRADMITVRSGRMYKVPEIFRAPARRVFFDGNPGQTQMHFNAHDAEREPLDEFEWRFTLGFNIGTPDSPIPCAGLKWHHLPRPVHLPMWPVSTADNGRFTTISSWSGRATFALDGAHSGEKSDNWSRYLSLPKRLARPMEVAMRMGADDEPDRARFIEQGWIVSDPSELVVFDDYRRFIAGSRAEFSVAHNRYVAFRTGWFSDRSAAYLACGKPVVVQSTGFERHLPTGQGLLTFGTPDEAVECIAAVEADYELHCRAARRIAEDHLAADRVLQRIVEIVT